MTNRVKTKNFLSKIITITIATLALSLNTALPASASPTASMNLSPTTATVTQGADVTLTISVTADEAVSSALACITFDTSKATYKGVDSTSSALGNGSEVCQAGQVSISRSGNAPTGTFTLATFTLTTNSPGTFQVALSLDSHIKAVNDSTIMASSSGSTVTVDAPAAKTAIVPPVSEAPTTTTVAAAAAVPPAKEEKKTEPATVEIKSPNTNREVLSSSTNLPQTSTVATIAKSNGFKPLPFILIGSAILLLGGSALAIYYLRKQKPIPVPVEENVTARLPRSVNTTIGTTSLVPASPPSRMRMEQLIQPHRSLRPRDL